MINDNLLNAKKFDLNVESIFDQLGEYKHMVLSTSLNDNVTSRMMSIIFIENLCYFQTDITFNKYRQISNNKNVSLCIDNISIEGICEEIGRPENNELFMDLYKRHFKGSFEMYTMLENERLFKITPTFIKKWVYDNKIPFIEVLDFSNNTYSKIKYERQ